MIHTTFSRSLTGAVAGLSAIVVAACSSAIDGADGTDTDETLSSQADDGTPPSTDEDAVQATPEGGGDTADAAPDANPPEEKAEDCEDAACAGTTVRPESTPDGETVPIPCSISVPSPPEGESYGSVMVRITLGNGSEAGIPFVDTQAECQTAKSGWYYAEASGVEIALCPQTCADAELGFEARYNCLPVSETATCSILGPPPNL